MQARKTRHATLYLFRFIRKEIFKWDITVEGLESFVEKNKKSVFFAFLRIKQFIQHYSLKTRYIEMHWTLIFHRVGENFGI